MKTVCLLISGLLISCTGIAGQVPATGTDSLFLSDKVIRMELRTDFSAIEAERTGTPALHEGELTYHLRGSAPVTVNVKVMARGNFRLNPANCSFPPLLIDLSNSEIQNTLFENQKRLKLVTPCQDEEDLIEEYLIYKMYNEVTDWSLRARLVRIEYFDISIDKKLFTKYSFFIEDKDRAAERNNASVRDSGVLTHELNSDNFIKLSVFQYIIGNKDWNVYLNKNVVLLQPENLSDGVYTIPYDFDFSGLINAQYTQNKVVPEDIRKERREYHGLCHTEKEFREVFDFYIGLRPVFRRIILKQNLLPFPGREDLMAYIDAFYRVLEDPELIRKEFLEVCITK